jgi:hypothetical protein
MPAMLDLLPLPLHPQGPGHWQPPRGEALNPCRTLKACSAFVLGPVVGFFCCKRYCAGFIESAGWVQSLR